MISMDDKITIDELLYFSNKVCNISLNKIQIGNLIHLESEEFFHSEYKEPRSFFMQELIGAAEENWINIILNNFEYAIKTNCGNIIDLSRVEVPDDWGYNYTVNENEGSLSKRYKEIKITPNNFDEFKLIWLKIFIEDLTKIVEAIHSIITSTPIGINQSIISAENNDKQKKYNSEFYVLAFLFDCELKGERYPIGEKAKLEKIGKERTKGVISGNTFYKKFNTIMELKKFDIHKEVCLIELCGENWREIILSLSESPELLDAYLKQNQL